MPDAADLARHFEGLSLRAYRCPAGVWTIGWGSTRDLAGQPVTAATPAVTREQADQLLERDLASASGWVRRLVKVPLTEGQRAALVDFTYNLGPGRLQASTLLRALNAGRYGQVPAELAKWTMGGGRVLPGLVARRAAEAAMWRAAPAPAPAGPERRTDAPKRGGWAELFLAGFRSVIPT